MAPRDLGAAYPPSSSTLLVADSQPSASLSLLASAQPAGGAYGSRGATALLLAAALPSSSLPLATLPGGTGSQGCHMEGARVRMEPRSNLGTGEEAGVGTP